MSQEPVHDKAGGETRPEDADLGEQPNDLSGRPLIERRRLPRNTALQRGARAALSPLRSVHSGHIGDYIAWLTIGVAVYGGILASVTR